MSWSEAWRSTWRLLLLAQSDKRVPLWLDLILIYLFWFGCVVGIHWLTLVVFA